MSAAGGNNQESFTNQNISTNPDGAILVWDLDKTLVAKYFNPANPGEIEDPIINTNALRIMNTAFKSKNFSANMMLTNNGNPQFIQLVLFLMTNEYNKMFPEEKVGFLFSVIYTAVRNFDGSYKDPRVIDETVSENIRQGDPRYAAKRLEDVRNMCHEGDIPADNLANRVFFFDDLPTHNMVTRREIPGKNYIQIEPPFDTVDGDLTNYEPLLKFLEVKEAKKQGVSYRNLANTMNMRKQSGGRKTKRKKQRASN
jgi:hypothetical protein